MVMAEQLTDSDFAAQQAELRANQVSQGREIHGLRNDLQDFMQEVRKWFNEEAQGRKTNWLGVGTLFFAGMAALVGLGSMVSGGQSKRTDGVEARLEKIEDLRYLDQGGRWTVSDQQFFEAGIERRFQDIESKREDDLRQTWEHQRDAAAVDAEQTAKIEGLERTIWGLGPAWARIADADEAITK